MIIKLFEISKEFFDLMYSQFIEDVLENEVIEDKLDEEKGLAELSDDEECEKDIYLCHSMRKLILFINPVIYKKLNANKVD